VTNRKQPIHIPSPDERTSIVEPLNNAFSDEPLKLPAILDIPDKLLPIIDKFNDYQYFLIEGGRSSAKSQSVARILLYLAEQKRLRIICGRETQNTIEESVYTILKDLIDSYHLNYDTLKTAIDHRISKSAFRFRGFREQGSLNIMGIEGCDILWFEQAEMATKQTLDIIIPTVRKTHSKIIFTMNRRVEQDPAFQAFAMRSDCLHIHINYNENKHCPQKMIQEAELCKQRSLDDYSHIWLGEPLAKSSDFLFGMDMLRDSISLEMTSPGVQRCIIGNDVARFGDCETIFSVLKSHGPIRWEQTYQEPKKHMDGESIVGRALSLQKEQMADAIAMDADGGGAYLTDFMPETKEFELFSFKSLEGWKDDPEYEKYGDRRTAAYYKVKEWMEKGWLKILADQTLIDQLLTIRYHYDRHGRQILFSKDDMRRDQIPSPDRADALAIAVFYADSLMGPAFHDNNSYARMDSDVDLVGKKLQAVMD
jgi:phage terminase large subunit